VKSNEIIEIIVKYENDVKRNEEKLFRGRKLAAIEMFSEMKKYSQLSAEANEEAEEKGYSAWSWPRRKLSLDSSWRNDGSAILFLASESWKWLIPEAVKAAMKWLANTEEKQPENVSWKYGYFGAILFCNAEETHWKYSYRSGESGENLTEEELSVMTKTVG